VAVVAGVMAFLAALALEAGLGAGRMAGLWQADLAGVATVRIPPADAAGAARVAEALTKVPGVTAARVVPAEEARGLLAPWLGEGLSAEVLPLPVLIDLRLGEPPPDAATVRAALEAASPRAAYDDHAAWRAPVERAARGLRLLVAGAVSLMALALAAMVVVAARASLAGAATTVRTLHLLGAGDGMIAATFDRGIAARAFFGALFGAPLAVAAVHGLPLVDAARSLALTAAAPDVPWLALAALPVGAGVLAWVTARLAILAMLRMMP
jgi:cell division transport system permease protein